MIYKKGRSVERSKNKQLGIYDRFKQILKLLGHNNAFVIIETNSNQLANAGAAFSITISQHMISSSTLLNN